MSRVRGGMDDGKRSKRTPHEYAFEQRHRVTAESICGARFITSREFHREHFGSNNDHQSNK